MRNNLFVLVIVVLFSISCEKESDNSLLLIGKWNWVYGYGGISGIEYTPESTGDKQIIEYTSDSLFRFYRNDTLIIECKYHVLDSSIVFNGDKAVIIKYDGFLAQSYVMKSWRQLYLYDTCIDCFENHYSRIQ